MNATGNVDTPVSIEVSHDLAILGVKLTGNMAKQVAEQLLSIWSDDLDNESPLASCGHVEWKEGHCATMSCDNYINKGGNDPQDPHGLLKEFGH